MTENGTDIVYTMSEADARRKVGQWNEDKKNFKILSCIPTQKGDKCYEVSYSYDKVDEKTIAVSARQYLESGCIKCGCDFCYNEIGISGGGTTPLKCAECGVDFFVLANDLTKATMGFGIGEKDEFEYPELQQHPRAGIPKHKFIRPDVRPENGEGEFCSPRGIGHDLACFVKSKEAGQRVVDMFNRICGNKSNHKCDGCSCFACGIKPAWLDYREHEPLWIQVKIQYCSKHEENINFLFDMISEDGIITEDKIKKAMTI